MKSITSAANPSYRRWLRLATQPRAVREERATLAEGEHLAEAALAAAVPVEALLLRAGSAAESLRARLPAGTPVYELSAVLYDRLGLVERGVGHALVLAVPAEATGAIEGDLLYLDGVQEPGNVGALLRVAAAAGVPQVWASGGCAALWAPKVLRAGQGAHFRLRLREAVPPEALRSGFSGRRIGTRLRDSTPLWSLPLPAGPVAWLMGSEGQGLSPAAEAVLDAAVTIPIEPGVESLNVASAAAVCLFERRRRLLGT